MILFKLTRKTEYLWNIMRGDEWWGRICGGFGGEKYEREYRIRLKGNDPHYHYRREGESINRFLMRALAVEVSRAHPRSGVIPRRFKCPHKLRRISDGKLQQV